MRNFHLLLTILPAGSDLLTNPPTGWHLRFYLANPCELYPLSLGQGGGFDTPRKEPLQADQRHLLHLYFINILLTDLCLRQSSHVSTVSASPHNSSPPAHFTLFPSFLTDIQYNYTLWLYIAFCSAKNRLTQTLAVGTGIHRKAENSC